MSELNNSPMKALWLHGYRDNAMLRQKQATAAVKRLSKLNVESIFMNAPFACTEATALQNSENQFRQWWSTSREEVVTLSYYDTLQESIDAVQAEIERHCPDGLIGFSQGSVLLAIMFLLHSMTNDEQVKVGLRCTLPASIKFGILIGSFPVTDVRLKSHHCCNLPTLHISGTKDSLIDTSLSIAAMNNLSSHRFLQHAHGHVVPSTAEICRKMQQFMIEACCIVDRCPN
jgi:predicted esterase